jgi:hypothetical protein
LDKLFKSSRPAIPTQKSGERLSKVFLIGLVDAICGGFETKSGCDRRELAGIGPYTFLFDPKNIDLRAKNGPVFDLTL